MKLEQIHLLAVLAAALSMFVIGGLWYSPLMFGRIWMRENRLSDADLARTNKLKTFGVSFLLALVMAANLAMFLADEKTTLIWGIAAGGLAGIGWVAAALIMTGLFERKTWTHVAINAGYHIVAFIVMGAVLGGWR